jgi:hypothetical protein
MFNRTSSGIRNTDLFYRNQYLIIVEGQDDIPFWSIFFPEYIDNYKRKFKPVGGDEIKKYIEEIYNNDANFGVALDSDYRILTEQLHNHHRILETPSYSIENIMLSSLSITYIIRIKSRDIDYDIEQVESWLDYFNNITYSLMVADLIIQENKLGEECLGDNCLKFLENGNTKAPQFNEIRIKDFINSLGIPKEKIEETEEKLINYKPYLHVRGHFFASAVLCFINHEVHKIRKTKSKKCISKDDFYTMAIMACKEFLSVNDQLQDLQNKAVNVAKEVVKILSP